MSTADDFMKTFMGVMEMGDVSYRCVKCNNQLEIISVKTMLETSRKLFFCKDKRCVLFGIITVVAKK